MPNLGTGSIFAGHRIEEVAGHGGMGVVYRATQLDLGRPVALKLISAQLADDVAFRERFKRESQLAASLDHPNVVPVFQAGEAGGSLFITMRYVAGTDLDELLAARGAVPPGDAVHVVSQIAAALDAAHARGLVHRDVKPANILVSDCGQAHVYLTDFGLTKDTTAQGGLTVTGQFVGTIDYAAPEQIEGRRQDARTDVYSLGCVLFRALTGHVPYERDSEVAKLFAHLNDPPPAVTELVAAAPSKLNEVIRRAMAKDPSARYPSAGNLARAAAAALGETAPATSEQSVAAGAAAAARAPATRIRERTLHDGREPRARASPRRRVALATVAGAAVILAAAAVFALVGDDERGGEAVGEALGGSPAAVDTPASPRDWRELSPAPTARQQVPAVLAGGSIWLVGGLTGDAGTTTVEGYDPVVDSWKTAPPLPLPLHHAMGVSYEGELVVLGGWSSEGGNVTAKTSRRVFALRGAEWVELPRLRRPRAAGAAATVGDTIVVVGGQAGGELVAETEVFDGERWRDGQPIPTPRDHLAAASDGRFLYAVGGRELTADRNVDSLERYDPEADRWETLPPMPTPRGGLGAAVVAGRLLAAGGETPISVLGSVESYDLARGQWSVLDDVPTPRHGVGVAGLGNALYVLGGATETGHLSSSKAAQAIRFARASGGSP